MVGVGIAQYGNLFNVKSYGNVWVTTLLNCGILGVGYLITCVLNLVKRIRRENIAFFVIFVAKKVSISYDRNVINTK